MALEQNITDKDGWFIGEDKELEFEVLQDDDETPEDASAWPMAWAVRRKLADAAAVVEKTTASGITVVGTFNVVRALNTQRVRVQVDAADTSALAPWPYHHALKRTDTGGVLAFGKLVLLQSAAH